MNWRDIKWELTLIAVMVFVLPPSLWVYRDVTTARRGADFDHYICNPHPKRCVGHTDQDEESMENRYIGA